MPIFMQIASIPGEAVAVGYRDTIELASISWGLSRSNPAGTPVFADISVEKQTDVATPKLALACANGKPLGRAKISNAVATGAGGFAEFQTINLFKTRVMSIFEADTAADEPPRDVVTLRFEKIAVIYRKFNNDGSLAGPVRFAWDLKAGTPFTLPES